MWLETVDHCRGVFLKGRYQMIRFFKSLCTGAFLYVRYSFLLISNKFYDSSLLHWVLFRAV
jgi:hypothetical protein